jgi:hypothetical protein
MANSVSLLDDLLGSSVLAAGGLPAIGLSRPVTVRGLPRLGQKPMRREQADAFVGDALMLLRAIEGQDPLRREGGSGVDPGHVPSPVLSPVRRGSSAFAEDDGKRKRAISGQDPLHREGGGAPLPQEPIRREPGMGPLRNGNYRGNPNLAPRCGAKTRLGCPCKGPAMANGRCRMHGGASTGPKTAEGKARIAAAQVRRGDPVARAAAARAASVIRRGRVICAVVDAGLPLEVLAPPLGMSREEATPPAEAQAYVCDRLTGADLTAADTRALLVAIRTVAGSAPAGLPPIGQKPIRREPGGRKRGRGEIPFGEDGPRPPARLYSRP